VSIKVYQGENEIASENSLLGEFMLEDIPPAPAGKPQIVVQFDYDIDGIVHVSAKDRDTGKEKKITVSVTSKLSDEERDEARERVEETWAAAPTIDREESIILLQRAREIAENNPELKEKLEDMISRFESALDDGDEELIAESEDDLLDAMYEV